MDSRPRAEYAEQGIRPANRLDDSLESSARPDKLDIEGIVSQYKIAVMPEEVCDAEDVKRFPNDVLLNYSISSSMDEKDLAYVFKKKSDLKRMLYESVPKESQVKPYLPGFLSYGMPIELVAIGLQMETDKLVVGDETSGGLLVADKEKREYRFPAGGKCEYNLLVNEQSANFSAFHMGFSDVETGEIFIRQNYLVAMNALSDVMKDDSRYERFAHVFENVKSAILGVAVGHELSEIEIGPRNRVNDLVKQELTVEEISQILLAVQGITKEQYTLVHRLRAYGLADDNVSQAVITNLG